MNKLALATLGIIGLLIGVGIVWAVQIYLSPEVPVTVEDAILTLTVDQTICVVGDKLNFSGTFTTDTYFITGQNITLWCDGVYTGYSNLTDDVGYYEIWYPAMVAGDFVFYTNTTINE